MTVSTFHRVSPSIAGRLQELLHVNIDSARGFAEAADTSRDWRFSHLCEELAGQCRDRAAELFPHVPRSVDSEAGEPAVRAAICRDWCDVDSALSKGCQDAALRGAVSCVEHIENAYQAILREPLTRLLQGVLVRQVQEVRAARNRLCEALN